MAQQVVLFSEDTGSADEWSAGERLRHQGPGEGPEGQDGKFARSWELRTVCEQGNDITGAPSPQECLLGAQNSAKWCFRLFSRSKQLTFGYCSPFPWHHT